MSPSKQAYLALLNALPTDGPAADMTAANIVVALEHLAVIRTRGEDATDFLHNLLSNDIKKLQPGYAQYSSFNSPKGRMLASFLVWRDDTDYLLQLSTDLAVAIHKKLSMYVLRAKVKLSLADEDPCLLGVAGPALQPALAALGLAWPETDLAVSGERLQCIRLAADRAQLVVPLDAAEATVKTLLAHGLKPAATDAWRRLDIHAGIPLITAATQDEFVAQMINFELIGGVSFQKGCYPGQEIVARTQYLGKLKKRMFFAHLAADAAPTVGSDVFAPAFGEQSCGKLLSVAPAREGGFDLLVVVQLAAYEGGDVHMAAVDGPRLRFGPLPYAVD